MVGMVACFGEMLMRLSAPGREPLLRSGRLDAWFGGAEANVAVGLAALGHKARVVTILPENPIGRACAAELRRHGVDTGGLSFREGRMGLYFHAPGAMRRPAEITYDRAGSAFAGAPAGTIDWETALEGCGWLHLSGITPALGQAGADMTLAAAKAARGKGLEVSFDFNFRPRLWAAWGGDPDPVLKALAAEATLLFASAGDLARICEFDAGGARGPAALEIAAEAAFKAFPRLTRIASTFRAADSVDDQSLSALLAEREATFEAGPERMTGIIERIGGGDGFAAGLIHGLLSGHDGQDAVETALACMVLKHAIPGDFCTVTPAEIAHFRSGSPSDVLR